MIGLGVAIGVLGSKKTILIVGVPLVLIAVFIGMSPGYALGFLFALGNFILNMLTAVGKFLISSLVYIIYSIGIFIYNMFAGVINFISSVIKGAVLSGINIIADAIAFILGKIGASAFVDAFKKFIVDRVDNALSWLPHISYMQPPAKPNPIQIYSEIQESWKTAMDALHNWVESVSKNPINSIFNGGVLGSIASAIIGFFKSLAKGGSKESWRKEFLRRIK